jgi:hypothetical protein
MEPNLQSLADYQICSGDEINPKHPLPSHLPNNKQKKKNLKKKREEEKKRKNAPECIVFWMKKINPINNLLVWKLNNFYQSCNSQRWLSKS